MSSRRLQPNQTAMKGGDEDLDSCLYSQCTPTYIMQLLYQLFDNPLEGHSDAMIPPIVPRACHPDHPLSTW
jgi:hypothetical protein